MANKQASHTLYCPGCNLPLGDVDDKAERTCICGVVLVVMELPVKPVAPHPAVHNGRALPNVIWCPWCGRGLGSTIGLPWPQARYCHKPCGMMVALQTVGGMALTKRIR